MSMCLNNFDLMLFHISISRHEVEKLETKCNKK